jgi:hypothetical protein
VDYAQLVKLYGATSESAKGRYSPAECIGARKVPIEGNPDLKHVSTSYVERQNLKARKDFAYLGMSCRARALQTTRKIGHIFAVVSAVVFSNFRF